MASARVSAPPAERGRPTSAGRAPRVRWWRWIRASGIVCLVAAGVVGGYLGWLLWGTGVQTARAQHELRETFEERLEASDEPAGPAPAPPAPGSAAPGASAAPVAGPSVPSVRLPGDAVAILRIPKIDLDWVVVEGTGTDELKKGPGHYENTAYPWDPTGRVAIAGHRTTYGRPFWSLDRLTFGDRIDVVTELGTFRYRVIRSLEIEPWENWVLGQTRDPTLVLTTCSPRFSAARRLVVFAKRVGG